MKKIIASLLLCTALIAPAAAMAKDVTITTTLDNYSGRDAYLAVYVTKPDGSYDSTLWVAGSKQRYLGDLRGWISAMTAAGRPSPSVPMKSATRGPARTVRMSSPPRGERARFEKPLAASDAAISAALPATAKGTFSAAPTETRIAFL